MEHFGTQCRQQLAMFCLAWIAYASTYLLRKPIGVIKVDMQRELAFSKSTLGWLDSAFLLPYAVMQILLGPIGDKYGAQLTFASALVISSLSMVTFGYWSSPYVFAVLLFVSGSAQSQCWPNMTKLLMSWFSDNVRSTMFGFLGTSIFAGGIMATALAVSPVL